MCYKFTTKYNYYVMEHHLNIVTIKIVEKLLNSLKYREYLSFMEFINRQYTRAYALKFFIVNVFLK